MFGSICNSMRGEEYVQYCKNQMYCKPIPTFLLNTYSNTALPLRYSIKKLKTSQHSMYLELDATYGTQILWRQSKPYMIQCYKSSYFLSPETDQLQTVLCGSFHHSVVTCLRDQRKHLSKISRATFLKVHLYLGYIDWKLALGGCSFKSGR
jgi:hypothetical protein